MKALVFDFDGTIANSLPIVISCGDELSKKYGYKKIALSKKIREKELFKFIKKELNLSFFALAKYVSEIKQLMNSDIKKVKVVKGIVPVLKKISKNYDIFILSSNSKENIEFILKKNKINLFKIYSDSSIFGKKHMIQNLLKKESLKKDQLIYIGDETRDIDACKKVGIKIIAVTWGYNSKKVLKTRNPDFIVDKPSELQLILDNLNQA